MFLTLSLGLAHGVQVKSTQDKFVAAKAAGNEAAMKRALAELDETQVGGAP